MGVSVSLNGFRHEHIVGNTNCVAVFGLIRFDFNAISQFQCVALIYIFPIYFVRFEHSTTNTSLS